MPGVTALIGVLVAASSVQVGAQTYRVLYNFKGSADGRTPLGGLVRDSAGNLYGTTYSGGVYNAGTVFKLDSMGRETLLYTFSGQADGAYPGSLIRDPAGNLYGIAAWGGDTSCAVASYGCGTVFELDTTGAFTVLHTFAAGTDGAVPTGLVRDATGDFYGTTFYGGDMPCPLGFGCGTVFRLDASGKEAVLYNFTGGTDGEGPIGLTLGSEGSLYGATYYGGDTACGGYDGDGCGTVFKVDRTGAEVVLHGFAGGTDGSTPNSELVVDAAGNLYGTTYDGGGAALCPGLFVYGCGTVFRVDASGKETVLYSFGGRTDGAAPGGLVGDAAGNLYGTAGGGNFAFGMVFKVDTAGAETVLHNFTGKDGAEPAGALTMDAAGNLYGTTEIGGAHHLYGVVFELRRY